MWLQRLNNFSYWQSNIRLATTDINWINYNQDAHGIDNMTWVTNYYQFQLHWLSNYYKSFFRKILMYIHTNRSSTSSFLENKINSYLHILCLHFQFKYLFFHMFHTTILEHSWGRTPSQLQSRSGKYGLLLKQNTFHHKLLNLLDQITCKDEKWISESHTYTKLKSDS